MRPSQFHPLRQCGMTAPFVLEGTMKGPMFLVHVKQCLYPDPQAPRRRQSVAAGFESQIGGLQSQIIDNNGGPARHRRRSGNGERADAVDARKNDLASPRLDRLA